MNWRMMGAADDLYEKAGKIKEKLKWDEFWRWYGGICHENCVTGMWNSRTSLNESFSKV